MTEPYLPTHLACHWCRRERNERVPAVIRVFSAAMSGGIPACETHRSAAETMGLEPLAHPEKLAAGYHVVAYEVVVNSKGDGYTLGRKLWRVEPKAPRLIVDGEEIS